MSNYLWNLKLEDFPCGWQQIYYDAVNNYPNGKFYEWSSLSGQKFKEWIDPVQTHDLFKKTFSNYRNLAYDTFVNLSALEIGDSITKLINYDVALFNLLVEWNEEITIIESCNGLFNPFEYFNKKHYMNYTFYFSDGVKPKFIEYLQSLRIANVNFHHQALMDLLKEK